MLSNLNPANKWPQVVAHPSLPSVIGPNAHLPLRFLRFQCLCIAPTYELAVQIGQVVEKMGTFCSDAQLVYAVRGNRSVYNSVDLGFLKDLLEF